MAAGLCGFQQVETNPNACLVSRAQRENTTSWARPLGWPPNQETFVCLACTHAVSDARAVSSSPEAHKMGQSRAPGRHGGARGRSSVPALARKLSGAWLVLAAAVLCANWGGIHARTLSERMSVSGSKPGMRLCCSSRTACGVAPLHLSFSIFSGQFSCPALLC